MDNMDIKPRILLVDDSPENIDILVEILAGYHCLVATNGTDALKTVHSENKPDLILLDINMPAMDGYQVIQNLKSGTRTKNIPVIFLTSNTEMEDEAKGLKLGAVDYITKPINPQIVLARVKNHLELKFAREKLEQQNEELKKAIRLKEDVENITRHDLKSPLNVVILNAQMLLEVGELSELSKKKAKMIEKAGYRILDMVNSSLDLYKMEQGLYDFKIEPVNVLDSLGKIKDELKSVFTYNEIVINVDGSPVTSGDQPFNISGEAFLFYPMFSNLLKNACEASPPEAVVTVNLRNFDNFRQITIHNQGVVPEAVQDKFFEKYITSGKRRGMGLGTYSARLIAENLNGSISMHSTQADGTTITLEFPVS